MVFLPHSMKFSGRVATPAWQNVCNTWADQWPRARRDLTLWVGSSTAVFMAGVSCCWECCAQDLWAAGSRDLLPNLPLWHCLCRGQTSPPSAAAKAAEKYLWVAPVSLILLRTFVIFCEAKGFCAEVVNPGVNLTSPVYPVILMEVADIHSL